MNPINILLIGPKPGEQGGISKLLDSLLSVNNNKIKYINIETYHRKTFLKIIYYIIAIIKYAVALIFSSIDIVHVHVSHGVSFFRKIPFIITSRISGKKVLLHIHSGRFKEFYFKNKKVCDYVLNFTNKILVVSKYWMNAFNDLWFYDKLMVLNNCIKVENNFIKQEKNNSGKTLLYIGHIMEKKGVFDLLYAFKELKKNHDELKIIYAGIGSDLRRMKMNIRINSIDNVFFTGWVEGDTKKNLLNNASVLVLPTYIDSFGIALLEAMNFCIPVVATNLNSIPYIVEDGKSGLLFEAGNINDLIRKINYLLVDKKRAEEMGKKGYDILKMKFSSEVIMSKLEKIYKNIL